MLTYNDLKKGTLFVLDGAPHEVLEYEFLRMQQRKPVAKTKIKNLITGKITERNFHQNETFDEAEIEKEPVKYLYNHRGEFWFAEPENPSKRFSLKEDIIGPPGRFLKANTEAVAVKFSAKDGSPPDGRAGASGGGDSIINIEIPIKADLKVKEAPPGIKGDTAQGGTKVVTLETDAVLNVPLFVNTGDTVRVNTETGEYVERVEKSKE